MSKVKIGILREGKVPPDHRVPLTPKQCKAVMALYPGVQIVVQPSAVRAYKDSEYSDLGLLVQEDLSECDILMGVKEVNVQDLIPGKTFLFFSHTIKKQPYNRHLLQAILNQKIRLVDYETIKNKQNKRLIGFGRYAGIVGAYNAFLTFGLKHGLYQLKPAHQCKDRKEMEEQFNNIKLPPNFKLVLTGFGRVGHGAREIVDMLPIKEVAPDEFFGNAFDGPVFTHLEVEDYYGRKDNKPFEKADFYANPEHYKSTFGQYVQEADMYIPCHFWNSRAPYIVTQEDLKREGRRLSVVADISCDIAGPIACTIRPSKISDPVYGYDPQTGEETDFMQPHALAVMAVDNLPCELPLDASEDFGSELMKHVLPCLLADDPDQIILRASETNFEGELTSGYAYLQEYVNGNE